MTMAPVLSLDDWTDAFHRLLPTGRVWPREHDSTQYQALRALMPLYAQLARRDNNLLVDGFPTTTQETLPEWEAALGLPDPCMGAAPTMAQRQALVVARLTGRGGQSVPYLVAYAAAAGYVVTVTEFSPFRVGVNAAGQPLQGAEWSTHWQVNAPAVTATYFRVGHSRAGDPLAGWGNLVLECELRRLAPAHTTVSFGYT